MRHILISGFQLLLLSFTTKAEAIVFKGNGSACSLVIMKPFIGERERERFIDCS
jgi:hypothetical protein